jgi:cytidylate kinase
VSIFIAADEEERVRNVCEREGVDEETAKKMIKKKESTRSSYYNYYTNKTWGAAASYDLCINISKLGYDKSFELILAFVKKYLNLED